MQPTQASFKEILQRHGDVKQGRWAPRVTVPIGGPFFTPMLSLEMACESPALPDPPTLAPGASRIMRRARSVLVNQAPPSEKRSAPTSALVPEPLARSDSPQLASPSWAGCASAPYLRSRQYALHWFTAAVNMAGLSALQSA